MGQPVVQGGASSLLAGLRVGSVSAGRVTGVFQYVATTGMDLPFVGPEPGQAIDVPQKSEGIIASLRLTGACVVPGCVVRPRRAGQGGVCLGRLLA